MAGQPWPEAPSTQYLSTSSYAATAPYACVAIVAHMHIASKRKARGCRPSQWPYRTQEIVPNTTCTTSDKLRGAV